MVAGHLVVPGSGGTVYDTCYSSNGVMSGSYSYVYTDGSTVSGYQEALCRRPVIAPGPPVCQGNWYEPGFSGVFINVVAQPGSSLYDSWWAGVTANISYATMQGDSEEHLVETVAFETITSPSECANNTAMYDFVRLHTP